MCGAGDGESFFPSRMDSSPRFYDAFVHSVADVQKHKRKTLNLGQEQPVRKNISAFFLLLFDFCMIDVALIWLCMLLCGKKYKSEREILLTREKISTSMSH